MQFKRYASIVLLLFILLLFYAYLRQSNKVIFILNRDLQTARQNPHSSCDSLKNIIKYYKAKNDSLISRLNFDLIKNGDSQQKRIDTIFGLSYSDNLKYKFLRTKTHSQQIDSFKIVTTSQVDTVTREPILISSYERLNIRFSTRDTVYISSREAKIITDIIKRKSKRRSKAPIR